MTKNIYYRTKHRKKEYEPGKDKYDNTPRFRVEKKRKSD